MLRRTRLAWLRTSFLVVLCLALLVAPAGAWAAPAAQPAMEDENPSPYYDSILYSEIGPRLREIERLSNRVRVEVIGQSAGGRDLYLVTLSAPEAMGRLGTYQAIRATMLKDPDRAQEMIDKFGDFKVPVFVNGSIHGSEYTGVDAIMRLIETLAFDDSEEVSQILDNEILLFNVVQNPDGRVLGQRQNAAGFDLNRDFITQSQPEVQATVRVLTEWNPMVVLDLHGFTNPMLIEPCTPPHNPNYEYDLYIKWALAEAEAMEAELLTQTTFEAQIPFRDFGEGWDDWPPIFTPMYAMYHGAYGHTLETPYRDERGVDAHYWAVWGGLKFAAENRAEMVHDQIEIFRRGFLDLPQVAIPQEILDQTPYDQLVTTIEFPAAYVIPAQAPLQQSPQEAARLVDFLLRNDVQVERSDETLTLDGVTYPAGSYVVWMNQPKRGLANTILWAGWDISYDPGLSMYDISGWSLPLLWGVSEAVVHDDVALRTHAINRADPVAGWVENAAAEAYAFLPDSNAAIRAANELLAEVTTPEGTALYRAGAPFADGDRTFGTGTFVLPAESAATKATAEDLARRYGLAVYALSEMPEGLTALSRQHLAVMADEGVTWALRNLGFDITPVSTGQLSGGADLSGYDAFVLSGTRDLWEGRRALNETAKGVLLAFFEGGGDYVGIGVSGTTVGVGAGLLDVDYDTGGGNDNGIVRLCAEPDDPITAQYPADTYGFVYAPLWFTRTGEGVVTSASLGEEDWFVSGFWWQWAESGAGGQPVVVHGQAGATNATLMGIDPTFRAHPALTFRMLANAIYSALD